MADKDAVEDIAPLNNQLFKEKFFREQFNFLFKNLLISVPSSLLCAAIVFVALYRIPHTVLLEFWFLALILLSMVRIGLALLYVHDHQCTRMRFNLFLLTVVMVSIIWGSTSVFLMPENYPIEQMITVIVLAGIIAGGVQSLQASLISCFLYILIILTPLCIWAYAHQNFSYTILGSAITFYLLFTLVISLRAHRFLRRTILLKYKNIHLAQIVQNEKEFLNAMLDNLEDGIIACDSEGKITVFNASLRTKVNIPKTEKLSNDLLNYFELHQLKSSKQSINHTPLFYVLNGNSLQATEFIMRLKNGSKKHVIINGQPIIKVNNEKLGAVIVIHDITDVKKSDKIKKEFVSVVSHELRTPLTSIQGSLTILMSGITGNLSLEARKLVEIANKNCTRLLFLINDILNIEKLEEGKMQFVLKKISMNKLVKEAIKNDKMYAEKYGVRFELKELEHDVEVYVDPDRLMQVLANLISNAVKFSPQKGHVRFNIETHDNYVHVSVTDNGPGIPEEFKTKIFQKFSQADSSDTRSKGGTGLGLAISKMIIQKLDGYIDFVSEPGKTTFTFHLPIASHTNKKMDKQLQDLKI